MLRKNNKATMKEVFIRSSNRLWPNSCEEGRGRRLSTFTICLQNKTAHKDNTGYS
jgi:hypothetical protein